MGRRALDTAPGCGDETLDGGGVQSSGEFLFLGLDTGNNGNGEELLVYAAVEVEDLQNLSVGFGLAEMCSVALLPEEFTRSEERLCGIMAVSTERNISVDNASLRGFLNSHRTTLFHWFNFRGRSRWLWIHLA